MIRLKKKMERSLIVARPFTTGFVPRSSVTVCTMLSRRRRIASNSFSLKGVRRFLKERIGQKRLRMSYSVLETRMNWKTERRS